MMVDTRGRSTRSCEFAGRTRSPHTRARRAALVAGLLLLSSCGKFLSPAAEDEETDRAAVSQPTRTLDGTGAAMVGSLRGLTYQDWDRERREQADNSFMGFRCIGNCLEHVAGYQSAQANKTELARDCTGNSWAMVEGCVAWTTRKKTAGGSMAEQTDAPPPGNATSAVEDEPDNETSAPAR